MALTPRRKFLRQFGITTASTAVFGNLELLSACTNPEPDTETKKLNIALCGLGRYAAYLGDGILNSRFCRVAGLITGTPEKEKTWGEKFNVPAKNIYNYQNFDSIADNPDIDLVYVVLPNSMHKEFSIRAAQAGKHVIVEKPMALNAAECEEMIRVCKENKVQLAVGYRLHYEPHHLEIKRMGQEKVFGPVRLIEVSLGYPTTDPDEWRLKKALAGGGPLMNIGIYCLQAARYVTGEEPISVTAQFGPVTDPTLFNEVEASITWQLTFPSGAVANSATTYTCSVDRFYAGATNGFFEMQPAVSYGPFRGRSSKGELNFPDIDQQAAQCDGIAEVLLNGKNLPDHIAGIEGWKDMKIIDAIYTAAREGNKKVLTW